MSDNQAAGTTPVRVGMDQLRRVPRVVTLGTFDGVHRGHQYLIDSAVAAAHAQRLPALAITFEPIPAMVLRPDGFPGRICTANEKLSRMAERGLDEICVVPFSRDFSQRTAEHFIAEMVERTAPVEVFVGEAFALGRGRTGGVARLTELGREQGFQLRALPRVMEGDEIVSSSAIRQAIIHGRPDRAAVYLGRPFRVSGPVVHSSHYGREIGFPTANVMPPPDLIPVADGIYAAEAWLPGETTPRQAMTYVGTRPTVNTGPRQIETHLLDFDGDLYGHILAVDLISRIRPDERFDSVEAMVAQLAHDEVATRSVLEAGRG